MKQLFFILFLFTILILVSTQGCVYNIGEPPAPKQNDTTDTAAVSYLNDVKPIIEMRCYYQDPEGNGNCHGPEHPGSQQFTTYENITLSGGGYYINKMSVAINHTGSIPMPPPPLPKLPQPEIDKIDKWIADGFPNN